MKSAHLKKSFGISLVVLGLLLSGEIHAKNKTPPEYQKATLKEIKETREPKTVYRNVKQANGSTLTLPQTEYDKVYHIKIALENEIIVGRYTPAFSFTKPPGWTVGQELEVRFQKNRMYIKKPNGKELKTQIEELSQLN